MNSFPLRDFQLHLEIPLSLCYTIYYPKREWNDFMKRLVLGILAHVDAGKTTLTEALLYETGQLRKLGRVDHGDAFLDTDQQEKQRGITIFSKQALLTTESTEFTLLDTPGHVDFSPEMERTLGLLDYAILVISGTDGVQSHTETLWSLLQKHKIPTFLFINKMDLAQDSPMLRMEELRTRLSDRCIDFSGDLDADAIQDQMAMCSEALMEEYLNKGLIQEDTIGNAIKSAQLFPCFFGSALKLEGVSDFLSQLDRFTLEDAPPQDFGGRVYKIGLDDQGNRLTYLKVTGGTLPAKAMVNGEKINSLRRYSGTKFEPISQALPGMVVAATGLASTFPGQGLGFEKTEDLWAMQPVMTYRVDLPEGYDSHKALSNLRKLQEEEPQLHVTWNEGLQEIRVQLMGQVQLEILQNMLKSRFDMEVSFSKGSIIYQETIESPVEGVGHYEPLRHYAEVHLLLEPTERGSGLSFGTDVSENELDRNWQRLILTHLTEKTHLGVLTGAPITDMRLTLVAGKAHLKHTEGGDFRQATYRAIRQGLMEAKSILLEPWYDYWLEVPLDSVGRAMADLEKMHGTFQQGDTAGDITLLIGQAPVSQMQDYPQQVVAYTHGRGRISCTLAGYFPCHNQDEVVTSLGYDPEADLENTPDSVFCSHGAGTVVKWYDVKEKMHLPSCFTPEIPQEEERTWEARAADYCRAVATDKELMAIFERTYGPIKKELVNPLNRVRHSSSAPQKPKKYPKVPEGPEYLLVDGYNIIFAWDDLKQIAQDNLDTARQLLINMLVNYQGVRKCDLILVFDAYRVKGGKGSTEKVGGIHVVYTKEAETADMYIERVTHEIGPKRRVRVATSDGLIQMIILGHGALRIPARAFRIEVDETLGAIEDFLRNQN